MSARLPLALTLLVLAATPARAADVTSADGLRLVRVPAPDATFDQPVNLAAPPGDPSRLFVVGRRGIVWLIRDGRVAERPFADVSAQVESSPGTENGLASIAFAPDYATSGRLYAFFTDASACDPSDETLCDNRIVELRRSADDPDVVDPASDRTVLVIPHGDRPGHHGGQLQVDSGGRLWAAVGDGAVLPAEDDPDSLHGKVLRIDDPTVANPTPVIWARGLRNPYRFSLDESRGVLILGDVGRATSEEVDVLPLAGEPPGYLGWPECEGDRKRDEPSTPCPLIGTPGYLAPAFTYMFPHANGAGCISAITGGTVLRDPALPALRDRYLFGDYCRGFVHSADVSAPGGDVRDTGLRVGYLTALVADGVGRLHLVSAAGAVYRLEPGPPLARPPEAGIPVTGVGPRDRRPPVLSRLRLAPRRFATGAGAARFRYVLSEPARVRIRFYRVAYRWRGGVHYVLRGLLARPFARGAQTVSFSGRLSGRRLAPGRYRATLRARDRAGNVSTGAAVTFTIVAG